MELGIADRLYLLNVLPETGDVTTIRIVRDLQNELSFDEEETARLGLEQREQGVVWKLDAEFTKDISIGPRAFSLIAERLEALSATKKLRPEHLNLYDQFVEGTNDGLKAVG